MNDLELKRIKIEKVVKYAALPVVALVMGAPLIIGMVQGVIGLVIMGGISIGVVNLLPWFSTKVANLGLKLLKHEAATNPVETLQNQSNKKHAALNDFATNLQMVAAQVASFKDEVKKYVRDGLEDAQVYVENLEKMKEALDLQQQNYLDAQQTLAEFDETIRRTDRKWKMACAAAKMNEAVGQLTGDVFDQICIETAVGAVQDKLNQAFAALDMENLKNKSRMANAPSQKPLVNQTIQPAAAAPTPRQRIAQ